MFVKKLKNKHLFVKIIIFFFYGMAYFLACSCVAAEIPVWGSPACWQKHSVKLVEVLFRGPFLVEIEPRASQLWSDFVALELFVACTVIVTVVVYFVQTKVYVLEWEYMSHCFKRFDEKGSWQLFLNWVSERGCSVVRLIRPLFWEVLICFCLH